MPEPVTRASQVLERFDDASDPEVVTTTAQSWVDLTAGREALVALDTVVQQDLETLRSAQSAASAGDEGLAADLVTERLELVDLLAAEELPANIAWIRAITERLVAARLSAIESANAELTEKVGEKARQIRAQYADANERRPGRSVEAARRPGASHHRGLGARAASPRSWTATSARRVPQHCIGQRAKITATEVAQRPTRRIRARGHPRLRCVPSLGSVLVRGQGAAAASRKPRCVAVQ